ncbi:hypothetical protein C8Q79DRAFT_137486 [Trametes meyenii]|nr:hypothetical protein C8Q79DRAFT_137486 [Trametes meyenii]
MGRHRRTGQIRGPTQSDAPLLPSVGVGAGTESSGGERHQRLPASAIAACHWPEEHPESLVPHSTIPHAPDARRCKRRGLRRPDAGISGRRHAFLACCIMYKPRHGAAPAPATSSLIASFARPQSLSDLRGDSLNERTRGSTQRSRTSRAPGPPIHLPTHPPRTASGRWQPVDACVSLRLRLACGGRPHVIHAREPAETRWPLARQARIWAAHAICCPSSLSVRGLRAFADGTSHAPRPFSPDMGAGEGWGDARGLRRARTRRAA